MRELIEAEDKSHIKKLKKKKKVYLKFEAMLLCPCSRQEQTSTCLQAAQQLEEKLHEVKQDRLQQEQQQEEEATDDETLKLVC